MGRTLGDGEDPLLVSVRSGAKFSMPGMMETVLNIGLGDASVEGLARQTGNPRFAWDSYRRLVQMYGKTVLDLDGDRFEDAIDAAKAAKGVTADVDLDADDLRALVATFKADRRGGDRVTVPAGPARAAARRRARRLRLVELRPRDPLPPPRAIPTDLGTAVNVQAMAFGNRGSSLRLGRRLHPRPVDRRHGRLRRLPAGRPGRGRRRRHPQHPRPGRPRGASTRRATTSCSTSWPASRATTATCATSSSPSSRGTCGCSRPGSASAPPQAAFRIAVDLVDEGVITEEEALLRVTGDQLAQLMFPHFDPEGARSLIAKGMSASPGAAVGVAVFDSDAAVRIAAEGTPVILVRRETNPDDLHGMVAAAGILTSRGGKTSHAAVVARGMGRTCVCGAETLEVDTKAKQFTHPRRHASCARATPCPSTARPARSSSGRSPCGPPRWCATSRAPCRWTRAARWSPPSTG